jgi:hypothetical protein
MSQSLNDSPVIAPEPAHRSRWQRFSPSMGWRAFWSEILIVVLGVVIALAANEAVSEWSWQNKVKEAETRLQGDITWGFLWSAERYATFPCVDAQLATMSRKVLDSTATLDPAPLIANQLALPYVVRMPNRPYGFPVWEALLADGTASHFSPQRQAFLGRISDDMVNASRGEAETRILMGQLLVMREPIALDPVVRADLLTHINQLRSVTAFEALNAQQRMRRIADAGSAPTAEHVELFLNASGKNTAGSDYSGTAYFCNTQGLPLADWRDYRKITANTQFPGAGGKKP